MQKSFGNIGGTETIPKNNLSWFSPTAMDKEFYPMLYLELT